MILGFESSCDESSIAIIDLNGKILKQKTYSQEAHHAFKGVVPEIASREHFNKIPELFKDFLEYLPNLNAVCATNEPGLLGPLLVGLTAGKTISYIKNIPFIPVHHLHAHMCSPLMEHENLNFPFMSILLSGGHSQIAIVKDESTYEILSSTVDDACGEAFDKGAIALGLAYPGAKLLDQLADSGLEEIQFHPSFMKEKEVLNFSFSGHKSALKRLIDENKYETKNLATSYRKALLQEVCHKVLRVLNLKPETKKLPWTLSGGVAANMKLRSELKKILPQNTLYVPSPEYCTDNAGMIAYLGLLKFRKNLFSPLSTEASPNKKIYV